MARPTRPPDAAFDVELDHLPPEGRWHEWMARVEAILFASATPVSRTRLAGTVGRDAVLDDLIGDLRADLADRPCNVTATDEGWHLTTQPAYAAAIRAAAHLPAAMTDLPELREVDLAVLAVLAAIATRQPVTRVELADDFGRTIGPETITRLRAHDVIARGPRSPMPGAPQTLVTTEGFLTMFGLPSLAELEEGSGDERDID